MFWGESSSSEYVFKIQKRALRYMEGVSLSHPCKSLFIKYKILSLPCLYIFQLLLYVKQNESQFITNANMSQYNLRNSYKLYHPFARLSASQRHPRYIGIILYNKLNATYKSNLNFKCFKIKVRQFLAQKCYYSVDEFLNDVL